MAEICNEDIGREIKNPSGQAFWTSSRLREITKKKLSRSYEAKYPVELLLYVSGREITPDNVIIPKLKSIIRSTKPPKTKFRRICFLGRRAISFNIRLWLVLIRSLVQYDGFDLI